MAALSAGIVLYRHSGGELEVLIGHPGGPFWTNKHEGAWSFPKGLVEPGEDARRTALREFEEETGHFLADDGLIDLGQVTLRSGKKVVAWAVSGDLDPETATCNTVQIEWPRGSGRTIEFPEVDELRWCSISAAERLLNPAQIAFLTRLGKSLDHRE